MYGCYDILSLFRSVFSVTQYSSIAVLCQDVRIGGLKFLSQLDSPD